MKPIVSQFRSPSERYQIEGDRLLSEGRTAEAILSYRAALGEYPASVPTLKALARLFAEQGRRRLAQRHLEIAAGWAPRDQEIIDALVALGSNPVSMAPLGLSWQVALGDSEPVGLAANAGRITISLDDGTVLCLNAADGQVVWRQKLPGQATSAPGIAGDQVWVGGQDGVLYTLSADSGQLGWKFATKAPIYVPPTAGGEQVFLASGDGTLYALNRANGSPLWSFPTGGALHSRPVLVGWHPFLWLE